VMPRSTRPRECEPTPSVGYAAAHRGIRQGRSQALGVEVRRELRRSLEPCQGPCYRSQSDLYRFDAGPRYQPAGGICGSQSPDRGECVHPTLEPGLAGTTLTPPTNARTNSFRPSRLTYSGPPLTHQSTAAIGSAFSNVADQDAAESSGRKSRGEKVSPAALMAVAIFSSLRRA
jgi:hypothetical protein